MRPIKYIRTKIFGMTQVEFAEMLSVSQPVVSDMEVTGGVSLKHQITIRVEAKKRQLPWSDSWFFELPEGEAA